MIDARTDSEMEINEQYYLYRKKFAELGKDCKKILSLFLKKVSMAEIMKIMEHSSISYTKKRKFMCKQKLIRLIQGDESYQELKED